MMLKQLQESSTGSAAECTPRITLRELALHLLIIGVILVLLFPSTFFEGKIPLPTNLLLQGRPWSEHAPATYEKVAYNTTLEHVIFFNKLYLLCERSLAQGEWPLWNHLEFAGMPLLANYQASVFYPPRLLHAFLEHYLASTLFIMLRFALCGLTAYVCGRKIGLGVPASRFLSVAWMLGAYAVHWCYWNEIDVAAWLPILFLGVEFLLRNRLARGFFAICLGGALILLAGHPETALAMSVGVGMYFVLRLLLDWKSHPKPWVPAGVALAAWGVALLACAEQILPFLDNMFTSYSFYHRAKAESVIPYIPPKAALSFWVPRFYGATADGGYWGFDGQEVGEFGSKPVINALYVSVIYSGMAAWVALCLLLPATRRSKLTRDRVVSLVVPSVFGAILAFDLSLGQPIHRLPLLSSMWRVHHIGFATFAIPLMGAWGVEYWFAAPRRLREMRWVLALAGVLVVAVGLALYSHWPTIAAKECESYVLAQVGIAALFCGLAVLLCAAHLAVRKPKLLASALLLVLAVDLLIAGRDMRPSTARGHIYVRTDLFDFLQTLEKPNRVSTGTGGIWSGTPQTYGIEEFGGYDALIPNRFFRLLESSVETSWDNLEPLFSITHYLFPEEEPPQDDKYRYLGTYDKVSVYENTKAFPRAFLVGQCNVVPDADTLFERLLAPGFDPRRTAITESPPDTALPNTESMDLGTARVLRRTPNTVTMDADVKERSVLVLTDTYTWGWSATIDGESADAFPVYYGFRGVVVEPGQHEVVYRYQPPSFRAGMAVSVTCLLLSLAGVLIAVRHRAGLLRARRSH